MYAGLLILTTVTASFLLESLWAHVLGTWPVPNVLLILVVFLNLYRGTRYSVTAALLAGLLKDAYSPDAFGLHMLAFVVSAYATTILKRGIYQAGSMLSRVLLVFLISGFHILFIFLLRLMFAPLGVKAMFYQVLLPEMTLTTVLVPAAMRKFKQCALKLSV